MAPVATPLVLKPFEETSQLLKSVKSAQWWLLGENSTDFEKNFDTKYPTLVVNKPSITTDQQKFYQACQNLGIIDLDKQTDEEQALKLVDAAINHAKKQQSNSLISFAESKKLQDAINTIKEFGTAFELKIEALETEVDAKIDTKTPMKPPKIPAKKFLEDCESQIKTLLPRSISKYNVESSDENPDTAPDIDKGIKIYSTLDNQKREVVNITPGKIELKGLKYYDMARLAVASLKSLNIPLDKELPITSTSTEFLNVLLKELHQAGYKNTKVEKSPEASPNHPKPQNMTR